jgi:hypothetical protein
VTSLRRTVLSLGVLCGGAVAFALGVNGAVEWIDPRAATPPTRFSPADIRRIDVHQHSTPGTAEETARVARALGLELVVNWSGGAAGEELRRSLDASETAGRRSIAVLANVDGRGCCTARWAAREGARLADARAAGARGLAIPGAFGDAEEVALDDPALDPLFAAAERLAFPVFVHVPAPAPLERRVARHPSLPVLASGFAGAAADPAQVSALLDRLPNLRVDTAALNDLGRAPAAARAAILAHPDRVLLGTDVRLVEVGEVKAVVFGGSIPGGREEMLRFFEGTWRFFETRDANIPSPVPSRGDHLVEGVGLSREVLEQIYHANAERLLGLEPPEAR